MTCVFENLSHIAALVTLACNDLGKTTVVSGFIFKYH